MLDGSEIMISKTLKEYEDLLKGRHFFRTHRSHLINLNLLKVYDKREGGSILMSDGSSIPLARNKRDIFMRVLDDI
jgi:two-component system LytT family response regulator